MPTREATLPGLLVEGAGIVLLSGEFDGIVRFEKEKDSSGLNSFLISSGRISGGNPFRACSCRKFSYHELVRRAIFKRSE